MDHSYLIKLGQFTAVATVQGVGPCSTRRGGKCCVFLPGARAQADSAEIPTNIKASLLGSLRQMKEQSVGQAGRELAAEALVGRKYQDLEPAAFFSKCYTLRSKLVHGESSGIDENEVNFRGAGLELFVGDLLSAPLLKDVPDL